MWRAIGSRRPKLPTGCMARGMQATSFHSKRVKLGISEGDADFELIVAEQNVRVRGADEP